MTTVRAATSADADSIGRIQVETWRVAYAGLLPQETLDTFDVEGRQRMWREGLARTPRPRSATFVAVVNDEVVGFATVGACDSEEGTGELGPYVLPLSWARRRRALIERSEQSLRDGGSRRPSSGCSRGTSARSDFTERRMGARRREGGRLPGSHLVELRYRKRLDAYRY